MKTQTGVTSTTPPVEVFSNGPTVTPMMLRPMFRNVYFYSNSPYVPIPLTFESDRTNEISIYFRKYDDLDTSGNLSIADRDFYDLYNFYGQNYVPTSTLSCLLYTSDAADE